MSQLKSKVSFFASFFLFSSVFLGPLAIASEEVLTNDPKARIEEANLPTQIIHQLYPAVPFYAAKVFLDAHGWKDSGPNKFYGYVILASAFHTAGEVPGWLTEAGIVKAGSAAQTLSSFAMFIPACLIDSHNGKLASSFFAAGTNQLGQGFRHALKENNAALDRFALNMNFTQHNREHIHEVAKSTGSVLALTALGYLQSGHNLASLADKVGASVSFTSAYVLREALNEHFRHVGQKSPELNTAALLSFAGVLGTILTNPGQMPAIVSEALLEAGFYTGVDHALNKADKKDKRMFSFLAAAFGAALYIPQVHAVTARQRIQNTLASAMLLPAAFATLDIAKEHISRLYYRE